MQLYYKFYRYRIKFDHGFPSQNHGGSPHELGSFALVVETGLFAIKAKINTLSNTK